MDYGEILSKSWRIIWKHKILWIFGILAGCSNLGGNSSGGGRGNVEYQFQGGELPPGIQGWLQNFQRIVENLPAWFWVLMAVTALVLLVIFILLTTVGRIGLIQGVNLADQGTATLSFGSLFETGLSYFWRVFLLNLLVGLALFIAFMIVLIPGILLGIATFGLFLLCMIPLFCLLVPLSWLISVIMEQANIAIVIENLGILDGLKRGWQVVTQNLGQYIVMAVILFIGGFIAALVIGLPLVLIALPGVISVASGSTALQGGLLISIIVFIIYLPILLLLNGIVTSYVTSAWTLTFRRLTGRTPAVVPAPEPVL